MTSVKYAISDYIADGTTTDYLITWDYLDEDHIAVYVDGTSNADPTASHTFTQLNDTTLRITDELGNAIVAGAEIEIRRETPLTTRAITFADGSALLASDLNKNSDYLLYSMQEVLDTVDAAAQDGALAAQVATEGFRDEAEAFKNTTAGYLATVQSDATDADNHRIAAAASEAAAATSEANAATSENNSATSAAASAASAAASLASEQAAAASEAAAAASETAAAASETAAANSATLSGTNANTTNQYRTDALAAKQDAEAALDSFDDRYLGAKSTAPTVDNDGDALLVGALYWNDVSDTMFVWNGSAWDTLNSTTGLADSSTSAQLTLTDTLVSSAQPFTTANPNNATIGFTTIADAPVKLAINGVSGHYMAIDDNQIASTDSVLAIDAYGDPSSGVETEVLLRARDSNGNMWTSAEARWNEFQVSNLVTGSVKTDGQTLTISVDDDGNQSNQAIYFKEGGVTRMSLEDNDVYVSDNINSGLRYESGGTNRAYDASASHISAYAANFSDPDTTGFASYRTYIQAYNTTDPDVAVFQSFSKNVMADTGSTSHNEKATAHMLDNGGRVWSWQAQYAGRVRVGTTATTSAYRAGDNGFTAYSGTGSTHGATTYTGFTQIYGRESANGDDVFLVTAGGQHRIEFDASGNGRFDGGADISAADYAEYFEWQDGNPNNEDRRGHSVVLNSDGTIRIATASDPVDDLIGIVSVEAAVVGDSAWAAWTGKHERDRFGQTVYEDYDLLCWGPYDEQSKSYKTQTTRQAMIDAGREDEIPEDAITVTKRRKKLAADYDPDREYIPRKDRQEWVAIGLMGKLPLLKGQPTDPRWRKLFDLNNEVDMWLVR